MYLKDKTDKMKRDVPQTADVIQVPHNLIGTFGHQIGQ